MTTIARDATREAALRAQLAIGGWTFSPFCCDEVDSTNRVALALADEGAPEGTVVLAEHQTAGRGRFDRSWTSPPGGLYLSLLLRPRPGEAPEARGLYGLTLSLALHETVEGLAGAGRVGLKWPNDLAADGRKLAGLLSTASTDGRGDLHVVVGVGLNLNQAPGLLPPEAVTLAELVGHPVDIDAVALTFLQTAAERVAQLRTEGAPAILDRWLQRSGWRGRRVTLAPDARTPTRTVTGVVQGLGPGGELALAVDGGPVVLFPAGDATIAKEGGA